MGKNQKDLIERLKRFDPPAILLFSGIYSGLSEEKTPQNIDDAVDNNKQGFSIIYNRMKNGTIVLRYACRANEENEDSLQAVYFFLSRQESIVDQKPYADGEKCTLEIRIGDFKTPSCLSINSRYAIIGIPITILQEAYYSFVSAIAATIQKVPVKRINAY